MFLRIETVLLCDMIAFSVALALTAAPEWRQKHTTFTLSDTPMVWPNPEQQQPLCGRTRATRLCDPSGLLTHKQRASIDRALNGFCEDEVCQCDWCPASCKIIRMGIAILPEAVSLFLQAKAERLDKENECEAWMQSVRTKSLNFGGCADILLLIIPSQQQKIVTCIGVYMQEAITAQCRQRVYGEVRHLLYRHAYGEAVRRVIERYREILSGHYDCRGDAPYVMSTGVRVALAFIAITVPLLCFASLVFFGSCFSGRGFGGARYKMNLGHIFNSKYHKDDTDVRWIPTAATTSNI